MDYLEVGKLVNTQGIKGEVRVVSQTDFPEVRFRPGAILYAFPKTGDMERLEIDHVRKHKNFILLHFKDHPTINDVEHLKPATLKIDAAEQADAPLQPGEYYYSQIIGLDVVDEQGRTLGTIKDIMDLGPNDVWVVECNGQPDLLLPKIDEVIKQVDLDQGQVTVELLEGLE
ncbi:ribosome maturation factor RimM [Fructilactobacillus myrtifloralis]|uniref:Ribosome maturation factor RimM n=1 Tax=Fructilactobacillus myrtifloralis TaxID=2940301 RepID=A0ABY5BPA3_9LACO|nr:ribosome maturation factor RimM [Fructilactobacillus myrtifloralis]USS85309.1 ribosome maturation factor RimM [Fructilactobacillus myrtifloralis]